MVDIEHAVGRDPYIEFDGICANGVGFDKGAYGVLGRSFGFPITAVGDDLRPTGGGRKCGRQHD